jgi:hypothetical protein
MQLNDGTSEKYGKTLQWHKILGSVSSFAEEASFLGYDAVLRERCHMFQRIICLYLQGQAVNKE